MPRNVLIKGVAKETSPLTTAVAQRRGTKKQPHKIERAFNCIHCRAAFIETCSNYAASDSVKCPRIIVQKFSSKLGRNILPYVDRVDELVFPGWIAVGIVRADEQMILASVLGDVRNILVCFASDVEPVLG